VRDRIGRDKPRVPPTFPCAQREVRILEIQKEMLVETSKLLEQLATHRKTGGRHVIDHSRFAVCPIRHADAVESSRRQQLQSGDLRQDASHVEKASTCGFRLASIVDDLQADDPGSTVDVTLETIDHRRQRARRHARVRIEKQEIVGTASVRALIASCGKSDIVSVCDEGDFRQSPARRQFDGRRRKIVDDDNTSDGVILAISGIQ
jgi:hypothetical protein